MKIRTALRAACLAISTLGFAAAALAQQASTPPQSPELQAKLAQGYERLEVITARAARVSDVDQLRHLQAAYGYYTDKALRDEVADLFTDDGTMELGLNGVYVGKKSIRKYLYSLTGGKP